MCQLVRIGVTMYNIAYQQIIFHFLYNYTRTYSSKRPKLCKLLSCFLHKRALRWPTTEDLRAQLTMLLKDLQKKESIWLEKIEFRLLFHHASRIRVGGPWGWVHCLRWANFMFSFIAKQIILSHLQRANSDLPRCIIRLASVGMDYQLSGSATKYGEIIIRGIS